MAQHHCGKLRGNHLHQHLDHLGELTNSKAILIHVINCQMFQWFDYMSVDMFLMVFCLDWDQRFCINSVFVTTSLQYTRIATMYLQIWLSHSFYFCDNHFSHFIHLFHFMLKQSVSSSIPISINSDVCFICLSI